MIVYRMHGIGHDVFDTTGALLHPGRWHSQGTKVVYAAEHASLAVLETLIHASGGRIPPRVISKIHIPDEVPVESAEWVEMPSSQRFGDRWVKEKRSAVLRVPSIAVQRMEANYIFNPGHPDFSSLRALAAEEFFFDPRFFPAA